MTLATRNALWIPARGASATEGTALHGPCVEPPTRARMALMPPHSACTHACPLGLPADAILLNAELRQIATRNECGLQLAALIDGAGRGIAAAGVALGAEP